MRQWWSKVKRGLGKRQNLTDELQQEMEAHLQFLIDENLERGIPLEEARVAARREFGNAAIVRERSYQSWQFPTFESLAQDIRYAMRGIVRAPVFSLIVILTLAVGIGANTAIFSAVYAVLLKPLPFPSGERLLWLGESSAKATGISVTWVNFEHWRTENHSFETMAGFQNADLTLTGRGQAMLTHAGLVTNEFFQLTGSRPMMGRLFTASDDKPGSAATVVVTEKFWGRILGGDSQIIGKAVTLNGISYVVIGVLARAPGFFLRPVDYYLPFRPTAPQASKRDAHGSMRVLALLKPGVTLAQARSDLDTILQRLAKADPGPEDDHRAYAEFLTEERTGDVRRAFVLLMGSVCLVLVLACANIGALLLIRMTTRAREMAIRTAIGAGRTRLARQLLTETVLVTFLGGAFGILLAGFGLRDAGAWTARYSTNLGSKPEPAGADLRRGADAGSGTGLLTGSRPQFRQGQSIDSVEGEQYRRRQQPNRARAAWRSCCRGDRSGCRPAIHFRDIAAEPVGCRDRESRIRARAPACARVATANLTLPERRGHSRPLWAP